MIPNKTYIITTNVSVVTATLIKYTPGGWYDMQSNGDPVCFSPDTIISFKEV